MAGLVTCDPIWIRTKDLLLRRQLLYPAELWDHFRDAKQVQIFQFPKPLLAAYICGPCPKIKILTKRK